MADDRWKMFLKTLSLQNFRIYTKSEFSFDPQITVIVGHNATGKTNLIEAAFFLATGKSFKASREKMWCGLARW